MGRFSATVLRFIDIGEGVVGNKVIVGEKGLEYSLGAGLRLGRLVPGAEGTRDRVCSGASGEGQGMSSRLVKELSSGVEGPQDVGCGVELLLLTGNGGQSFKLHSSEFSLLYIEEASQIQVVFKLVWVWASVDFFDQCVEFILEVGIDP
ncbi:hypothetical protein J132_11354 [Termitomyces sp. J132]|nr:hypothetical protein J132_11354 [Termitomyces sp. J132]